MSRTTMILRAMAINVVWAILLIIFTCGIMFGAVQMGIAQFDRSAYQTVVAGFLLFACTIGLIRGSRERV